MKLYSLVISIFLFFSANVFAQKVIKHKVKPGESIYALAKKYDVDEAAIYDLNPKLKGSVLALKTEVKIPNKKYKPEEKRAIAESGTAKKANSKKKDEEEIVVDEPATTHLVAPKETLYSISKKYNVSMESLCDMNPVLKTGPLKSGMVLKLPYAAISDVLVKTQVSVTKDEQIKPKEEETNLVSNEPKVAAPNSSGAIIHKVQPKETLFRISKRYNVSIAELKELNPTLDSGLPVGYDLVVKKGFVDKTVATQSTPAEIQKSIDYKPLSIENMSKAEFLIAKASENLGTHYRSGGTTSAGFDCSGLMFNTFKNIDMTLPRSSYEMAQYGTKIDKAHAQKGDLIFFATFGRGRVSHVGMVTEVVGDEIKFIHSSTQAGVIISSTKEDYYTRTFVQVNRVLAQ